MSISSDAPPKNELRAAALARRDALDPQQRAGAAVAMAARMPPLDITSSTVVAGYAPIRSEIDPVPLMQSLARHGAALVPGAFGISEPSATAAEVVPDIVLVPLVAFDRAGHRIGYGAGYYDRTLEALRRHKTLVAIGLAFTVQEIPQVPALPHDVRLDYVLTETDLFDFRSL